MSNFLQSINLDIPQESPWEIGIDTVGKYDRSVKEMPHYCNVSMQFTPIHPFRPAKQKNIYKDGGKELDKYGKERYIQLKATGNNYDNNSDSDRFYKPEPRFSKNGDLNINTVDGAPNNNIT